MTAPSLEQFRIEAGTSGIIHLVFDAPGRTMNVFSNAAIHELGRFAAWLKESDAAGVVVRSGKDTAFCAGADLAELGVAYDMIMAAPPEQRTQVAFDHFVPLSLAIRALETAGKPVACAVAGLALGGGCELAMGAHYRVLADTPQATFGLPESLVGLLPGGGGTQRLPRLIGVDAALPILLEGARLGGTDAVATGLADAVVPAGAEIAAAEEWILTKPDCVQPWDRAGAGPSAGSSQALATARTRIMQETFGHYPAPLAILDCIERGLPQPFDRAMRTEMEIFSHLIQRPEPRNMIRTLFHGKLDYERRRKDGALPRIVEEAVAAIRSAIAAQAASDSHAALKRAGFTTGPDAFGCDEEGQPNLRVTPPHPPRYWFERKDLSEAERAAASLILSAAEAAKPLLALDDDIARLIDYASVKQLGFPSYPGGPVLYAREST